MSIDPFDPSVQDLNENSKFHLKEFVYKYFAYWKWFILSLGICLVLAFIYLKVQTPIFSVQSSILIKDQQKGLGEEDDMMKELNIFSSNKVVDNEIEVIKSYTLMAEVVDSLKLNIGYYRQGFFRKVELYDNSPVNLQLVYANALTYKAPLKVNIINRQTASINGQTVFFDKVTQTPYGVFKLTNTGKSVRHQAVNYQY